MADSHAFGGAQSVVSSAGETSGDGTPALKWGSTGVYSEDAEGKPRYDWTILDRIFDTYKEPKYGAEAVWPESIVR